MIYLILFLTFFKIGLFTFGGGYAMIPLIQEEVLTHSWLTLTELIDFIAISESTPGPFAINIATFIGLKTTNILGSITSTLGVILPSFIIIIIIAKTLNKYKNNKLIKSILKGLKPCVVGLILATTITTFKNVFIQNNALFSLITNITFYKSIIIFIVSTILIFKKVHPIKIILTSSVIGILINII